jgi:1,4-alpha-glucan branching enzyme
MGQEFLEDKNWSDNPRVFKGTLLWWDGLSSDRHMQDHLRFTKDLVWLRRHFPVLRSDNVNPFYVHNDDRVLAFHRWIDGSGEDAVVVASLNDSTFWEYALGLPWPGHWREIFNSDYYDHFPNPRAAGNRGGIVVAGPAMHGFGQSATVTIPANCVLVLARS